MFKLLRFLKGHIVATILGPLFKLMEALFELIIPLVVSRIIDVGIVNGDTAYIWKMGGLMLALALAGLLFSLTCQYLAARASLGFGTNVRGALYKHINTFSYNEIDKFGAPSLVTRLTNDVNQTQVGVAMFIRLVLRAPFIVIGSIVMAIIISPKLSIIFIGMAVVLSVALYIIMSKSRRFYDLIQKKLDGVALLTRENLTGARVVRAFSKQAEEEEDFKTAATSLAKTSKRVGLISALLNPLTYALVNTAIILILWVGGFEVNNGALSSGHILALVNYLLQIFLSMIVLANLVVTFTKSFACAKRINEVFETSPSILNENTEEVALVENCPIITFKNVNFSYGKNLGHSLENINIKIERGQTIGIIGSTGAGKTTFINLLNRFYDAVSGEILLDGVNVKQYPFKQMRDKIGLVPQKTALFSGTIRENIVFGKKDIPDSEIWRVLKIAQSEEFVMQLSDGLDTKVLQGGKNFSGGQKQRLTIARALVGSPEILILDDSSSALDYATDANLRKALKENSLLMTIIIISQRATSIKNADQILVLDEGKMSGLGTHDDLLKSSSVYREICSSQIDSDSEATK